MLCLSKKHRSTYTKMLGVTVSAGRIMIGTYPGDMNIYNLHVNVHSSFICNSQNVETTKMSFNEGMVKMWFIHTMDYHSVVKRNK